MADTKNSGTFSFLDDIWSGLNGVADKALDYFTAKTYLDYEKDKYKAQWEYQQSLIPPSSQPWYGSTLGQPNLIGLGLVLIGGAILYKFLLK